MGKENLKAQVPGDPAKVDASFATGPGIGVDSVTVENEVADGEGDILDPVVNTPDVEDIPLDAKDTLINELYAENLYLKNLLSNANIEVKTQTQVSEESLPEMADVDPTKIKTNTLTKGGWVLPE